MMIQMTREQYNQAYRDYRRGYTYRMSDEVFQHFGDVYEAVRNSKRNYPDWIDYRPVSDGYTYYHMMRVADYGGSLYEQALEQAVSLYHLGYDPHPSPTQKHPRHGGATSANNRRAGATRK